MRRKPKERTFWRPPRPLQLHKDQDMYHWTENLYITSRSFAELLLMYRSSQNYYRQSSYSWEFIFPKLPLPLPSWNSDEFPLPLPSWRPQSPLHFHWFPITVLKVIWIHFPQITVTVTVLKCFWIRKVIISNMTGNVIVYINSGLWIRCSAM